MIVCACGLAPRCFNGVSTMGSQQGVSTGGLNRIGDAARGWTPSDRSAKKRATSTHHTPQLNPVPRVATAESTVRRPLIPILGSACRLPSRLDECRARLPVADCSTGSEIVRIAACGRGHDPVDWFAGGDSLLTRERIGRCRRHKLRVTERVTCLTELSVTWRGLSSPK
jgi:hypothetical protein